MSPHAMSGMLKTLLVQRFKLADPQEYQPVRYWRWCREEPMPKLKQTNGSARSECSLSLAESGRSFVAGTPRWRNSRNVCPSVAQAYLVHPLVDLTGLTGAYDFTLTWTPRDRLRGRRMGAARPCRWGAQASTPNGDLTVFEAIDKQLGLKVGAAEASHAGDRDRPRGAERATMTRVGACFRYLSCTSAGISGFRRSSSGLCGTTLWCWKTRRSPTALPPAKLPAPSTLGITGARSRPARRA